MDYEICPMEPKYAQGRGYVHFTAWQETYGELMDERFLRAHTLKACVDYALERPDNGFVALVEGGVVGFACLNGEARDFVSVPGSGGNRRALRAFRLSGAGHRVGASRPLLFRVPGTGLRALRPCGQ